MCLTMYSLYFVSHGIQGILQASCLSPSQFRTSHSMWSLHVLSKAYGVTGILFTFHTLKHGLPCIVTVTCVGKCSGIVCPGIPGTPQASIVSPPHYCTPQYQCIGISTDISTLHCDRASKMHGHAVA